MNWNWSYDHQTPKLWQNLFWLVWPWPFTLTFCMDITSVNGKNSWKFHCHTMMGTLECSWKAISPSAIADCDDFAKCLMKSADIVWSSENFFFLILNLKCLVMFSKCLIISSESSDILSDNQQGKSEWFDSCHQPSNQIIDFSACELEIWWITLENNRALLLYYVKVCASFQSIGEFKLELQFGNAQFR